VSTDTLTGLTRAYNGSTARAFDAGDIVEVRITTAHLQEAWNVLDGSGTISGNDDVLFAGNVTVGNSVLDSTNSFLTLGDGGVGATHNTSALTIDDNSGGAISIGVPAAGNRSIWFAGPTEVHEGQIQYQESTNKLSFGTKVAGGQVAIRSADNQDALTIDSAKDSTFAGDAIVEGQVIAGGNTTDTTNTNYTLVVSKTSTSGRLYLRDLSAGFTTGNSRKDGTVIISDNGLLTIAGAKEDGSASSTVQLTIDQNNDEVTVAGGLVVEGSMTMDGSSSGLLVNSNIAGSNLIIDPNSGWAGGAANANADHFVIQHNTTQVGMSIMSSTSGNCNIYMGDTANGTQGRVFYQNASDAMAIQTGNGVGTSVLAMTIDSSQDIIAENGDFVIEETTIVNSVWVQDHNFQCLSSGEARFIIQGTGTTSDAAGIVMIDEGGISGDRIFALSVEDADVTFGGYAELGGLNVDFMVMDLADEEIRVSNQMRYSSLKTLTGTTPTWDLRQDPVAKITTSGNTTITINNEAQGTNAVLTIVQTASHTMTWPSNIDWAGGTAPDISTGTTVVSLFCYDGTNMVGTFSENVS
jgi:hypothetical protein